MWLAAGQSVSRPFGECLPVSAYKGLGFRLLQGHDGMHRGRLVLPLAVAPRTSSRSENAGNLYQSFFSGQTANPVFASPATCSLFEATGIISPFLCCWASAALQDATIL